MKTGAAADGRPAAARFDRVGAALVMLRERAGLSQKELAEMAGITPAMLSNYETGTKSPSLRSFGQILDALDVSLGALDDALDVVNVRAFRREPPNDPRDEPIEGVDLARFLGTGRRPLPPRTSRAFIEMILGFRRAVRLLARSETEDRPAQRRPPRDEPPKA